MKATLFILTNRERTFVKKSILLLAIHVHSIAVFAQGL
jgi:hypothetical protein